MANVREKSDGRCCHGTDIYTEAIGEYDTVANLGPLRPMAGIWEGSMGAAPAPGPASEGRPGADQHPWRMARGTYELHPIDFQTNGPQLFYGMRYHTHILKPGEQPTFHDQVGYWLGSPRGR